MRVVFDLDDTICKHKKRQFEKAVPIKDTVEKMRQMKKDGWEIIVYTARGQNSCKGNLADIEKKYADQITGWLSRNNVPFDELRFGKPLADLYVDDKGIGLAEFRETRIENCDGNSGATVVRVGDKIMKSSEEAPKEAEWYSRANELGINTPRVHSVVLNTITIDFIDGIKGSEKRIEDRDLYKVIQCIKTFEMTERNKPFDSDGLCKRLGSHLQSKTKDFVSLFDKIKAMNLKQSFCHGDLSMSNVIFKEDSVYLIDPIYGRAYSSYFMDYGKMLFSLNGGETLLSGKRSLCEEKLEPYKAILERIGALSQASLFEATYWIRLLNYSKRKDHDFILKKAKEAERRAQ